MYRKLLKPITCPSDRFHRAQVHTISLFFRAAAIFLVGIHIFGCGSGAGNSGGEGATQAPTIVSQPGNQSIPMGLTAKFSVAADGWPMSFQWMKNGVSISGATSESYTTPATAFVDSGSAFSVTISNSLGTVTSAAATLTVTARAPAQGDLRFQQVDSPSTVNGLTGGGEGTFLGGALSGDSGLKEISFDDSIGTPLSAGASCASGVHRIAECFWGLASYPLPTGTSGLATYYEYFSMSDLATELNSLNALNAVVTGLDVEPLYDGFAASWVQPSTPTYASDLDPWNLSNETFDVAQTTIGSSEFQSAASQDGANGRVITAVSWNSGQIFYLSYGWARDTTTAYDVQTASATTDTVSSVAQQLAAEGYVITALGGTTADGILLVGTRVRGDTAPRPILVTNTVEGGSSAILAEQGYAIVGFLFDSSGNQYTIGER